MLPGVTVEAASPALTEKVRTALTDGTGQYRIVTLPPGNYIVTFSLTGFTTVKRDNVTVSGSGVIPINADLRLGSLQETITVSGESPLVDTQTTRRETVINSRDHQCAANHAQLRRRALCDAGAGRAAGCQRQRA